MKKIAVDLIVILLIGVTVTPGIISLEEMNDEEIVLDFSFQKPRIDKVRIDDDRYDRVIVDGLPNSGNFKEPRLPVRPVRVLLPLNTKIKSVEVKVSEKVSLGAGYDIELGQKVIPLIEEQLIKKQKLVELCKCRTFPRSFYSIVGIHSFRGYLILFINLYPVQYNPNNGEIFYYENMELVVKLKECQANNALRGLERDRDIVATIVDNPWCMDTYEQISPNAAPVDYAIITNEALKNSSADYTFQDLVDFKKSKGINATIVSIEEIIDNSAYWVNGTWGDNNPSNPFYESEITTNYSKFNDTQAKIRNFIRCAYYERGTDYVLLGGDADVDNEKDNIIPARCLYANETGLPLDGQFEEDNIPSDVYYACLDGNFNYDMDDYWGENASRNDLANVDEADLIAEVWIGRACVDSSEEVSNFVMKTLAYEKTNDSYLRKALLVGEYLGFPGESEFGGNYKDVIKPYIPKKFDVNTLYDRDWPGFDPSNPWSTGWNKADLMNILNNDPPHLINHDGHGNVFYALRMYSSDIDSLINEKYFFIYSQTCLAGAFDNDDCAAEHFTVETLHGAVAVIMNARYGLGSENSLDSPSGRYDESFFKALFTENMREIGRANHYSKEDNVWRIDENGMRWCYWETNLFGDPQLKIKNPGRPEVNLSVDIVRPQRGCLYVFDREVPIPFLNRTWIIGSITVKVNASSDPPNMIEKVEFYVDGKLRYIDDDLPYKWIWKERGIGERTLTIVVNGKYDYKASDELRVIKIF